MKYGMLRQQIGHRLEIPSHDLGDPVAARRIEAEARRRCRDDRLPHLRRDGGRILRHERSGSGWTRVRPIPMKKIGFSIRIPLIGAYCLRDARTAMRPASRCASNRPMEARTRGV